MEPKDVLTSFSVIVSACALLYAWRKDNNLKRREHADRVRRAAGSVVARLERYRTLALSLFEEIQPLLTEADSLLVKHQDTVAVRDFLWRGLVLQRAEVSRRMLAEEVELAYVDLFGYDTRIHALFTEALTRLQRASLESYETLLDATQYTALNLAKPAKRWSSAVLGNELRKVCGEVADELSVALWHIVSAFRTELTLLAVASDIRIVTRSVAIGAPENVFRSVPASTLRRQSVPRVMYSLKGGVGRSLELRTFLMGEPGPGPAASDEGSTRIGVVRSGAKLPRPPQ